MKKRNFIRVGLGAIIILSVFFYTNNKNIKASNIDMNKVNVNKNVNKVNTKNNNALNVETEYNEYDKEAHRIIKYSGMWTEKIDSMLSKMTSAGVERIVAIYMQKNGGDFAYNNTKKAFKYINKTVSEDIKAADSKKYYDMVADEWYKRTKNMYLVMMIVPEMSTQKIDELVTSYTTETTDFQPVYKLLNNISSEAMDKIVLDYVKKTNNYGLVLAAVDSMTKEGQKKFKEQCPFDLSNFKQQYNQGCNQGFNQGNQNCNQGYCQGFNNSNNGISNSAPLTGNGQQTQEPALTEEDVKKFNDSDKRAYRIIKYSGMWSDELRQLLPSMSSFGLEKTVSLYMYKTRNFNMAKEAFRYIDNKVNKEVLSVNSKEYYDLVADEWYNRTKSMYLVMMIVPEMSTQKVDAMMFEYMKNTNDLHSLYSILNYLSKDGVDKSVLHYVEATGNYGIALAAVDFMTEDGRKQFMSKYNINK